MNYESNNRTFLMIKFVGEEYPMPIKICAIPYKTCWAEDRLGANLSVKYMDDNILRFEFRTGLFTLKGPAKHIFWEYISVRGNRFGSDDVTMDISLDRIERYWVGVYDQEGVEVLECRTYWELKYNCRYDCCCNMSEAHLSAPNYQYEKCEDRGIDTVENEKIFDKLAKLISENMQNLRTLSSLVGDAEGIK